MKKAWKGGTESLLRKQWSPDQYDIFNNNCNHFCFALCGKSEGREKGKGTRARRIRNKGRGKGRRTTREGQPGREDQGGYNKGRKEVKEEEGKLTCF